MFNAQLVPALLPVPVATVVVVNIKCN